MASKTLPPFPVRQMFVLALCRICEPIAFMSIFPYIYYMIEDFHITEDESKISVYAGMVTSAFTLAEFSTGVMWGKLSDRIGRKPVLLTGLAGTALSVMVFGFAPNLTVALIARALGGLLNGNIGVLQTTVAELVTVKEHQPRAYTIMPLVWCLGSIVGPMIGGALARPCISYPNLFARGTIWDKYPYLLPNLFSAATVCCGVIIGLLFLEETHSEKKYRRDRGVELGKHFMSWMRPRNCQLASKKAEKQALLDDDADDDELPGYRTTENSPRLNTTSAPEPRESLDLNFSRYNVAEAAAEPKPTVFTRPVVLNIISYGILAFHTMTFDQLFPVFLSTKPPAHKDFHLPFKFVDGFGMETKEIGVILSVQGVYSMFSNLFLFPLVTRRLGPLRLFRILAMSYFLLYFTTPYLVLLPDNLRLVGIYMLVIWKCTFSTMAYPSNAILLTNAVPNLTTLGMINGVAASTASLCRAFGPTISGLLYALGLRSGYSGLAWWTSGLITIIGAFLSLQITEGGGRFDEPANDIETAVNARERDGLLTTDDQSTRRS
ncbi:MFS general substrate transporter [Sodiomyces alkalinus F11]|uniref:MFS general substrate transporter n=1 Tax=Sodiomyces alkalinus (strain CBS 110278 / VKM F-3762 / F11) TaxID=1314773 RepID=A0A3N2Q1R0_SODAK|nr:MFS general substrate transporter [Sodiomyces alkalinus F11]ROT40694.1 MFS general substrate transporter [Sodiomyces alkalinus F11]